MKSISIISTSPENLSVQVQMEGDLIIRDSAAIKGELSQFLATYQSIEIHFKNIDNIDMSVLQLLVALQKSASDQNKLIKYYFEESEYLSNILNNSGFKTSLSA